MKSEELRIGQQVIVPEMTFVGVRTGGGTGIVRHIMHRDLGDGPTAIVSVELENGDVHEYFASTLQEVHLAPGW